MAIICLSSQKQISSIDSRIVILKEEHTIYEKLLNPKSPNSFEMAFLFDVECRPGADIHNKKVPSWQAWNLPIWIKFMFKQITKYSKVISKYEGSALIQT